MDTLSVMDYIERNYKTFAKAISILSQRYHNISIPMFRNFSYDLLIEGQDSNIYKVKVLNSDCQAPSGAYVVNLRSFGGYRKGKELKKGFDQSMCDMLFIESPDGYYLIETNSIDNKRAITLSQFDNFKITIDGKINGF